jgi:hypothetical protein
MLDLVQILKENHNREQSFWEKHQNSLYQERIKIEKKIEMAYEDRLDWRITGYEYDKKVQELKKKDQDVLEQLKDHSKGDEAFLITSSYILELAHRAYDLFKSSQTSKKRELINFVFANFEAEGSKLEYKTKEPFNELLFCGQMWKWLRLLEDVRTGIENWGWFHLCQIWK